jgi:hypothetical protein
MNRPSGDLAVALYGASDVSLDNFALTECTSP